MMRVLIAFAILLTLAACGGGSSQPTPTPPSYTTATATNGTTGVTVSEQYGTAVSQITDGAGNQYVNDDDHGREVQMAYQLDGNGEAENPTEAGSSTDGAGGSSSNVQSLTATGNVLTASENPAYWEAYNGVTLSQDTLVKTITVGWQGNPNIVEFDYTLGIAAAHTSGAFEGLTGYFNIALSDLYQMNGDGSFSPVSYVSLQTDPDAYLGGDAPLVIATPDGTQAVGLFSPGYQYVAAMGIAADTNKVDCAYFGEYAITAGQQFRYSCWMAFGTLAQVEAALNQLDAAMP